MGRGNGGGFPTQLSAVAIAPASSGIELVPQVLPRVSWTRVALANGGKLALVGESTGAIRVIDLEQRRILRTLTAHSSAIEDLVISADGTAATSASTDGVVCTLDLGRLQTSACRSFGQFATARISPDGRRVLFAPSRNCKACSVGSFDVASGGVLHVTKVVGELRSLAWSPDGQKYAAVGTGGIWVYDTRGTRVGGTDQEVTDHRASAAVTRTGEVLVAKRQALGILTGSTYRETEIHHDKGKPGQLGRAQAIELEEQQILVLGADGYVSRVDLRTGVLHPDVQVEQSAEIDLLARSPDGASYATASARRRELTVDGTKVAFQASAALTARFARNGDVLIGTATGLVRLDRTTGVVSIVDTAAPVVQIGDDGTYVLATGQLDNLGTRSERAYDVLTVAGNRVTKVRTIAGPTFELGLEPPPPPLVCDRAGACDVVGAVEGQRVPDRDPDRMKVSGGKPMCDGARGPWCNGFIAIAGNGKQTRNPYNAVALSPDGATSYAADGPRVKWGGTTVLPDRALDVELLSIAGDGRTLIAGLARDAVVIDIATKRVVQRLVSHSNWLASVALSHDGKHALTVSTDGLVRLSRVDTGVSVAIAVDGHRWIMYADDGLFDGSRDGAELVAAVEGSRIFTLDQLALRNNRPDVLLTRIGFGSAEVIDYFRHRHEKRIGTTKIGTGTLGQALAEAPSVRIDSLKLAENSDGTMKLGVAELTVALESPVSPLASYQVWVDRVPLFAVPKPVTGARATVKEIIEVNADAMIEVLATSEAGASSPRVVRQSTVPANRIQRSDDLYFLAIGVSKYRDPELSLAYAVKDARDLAAIAARQAGTGFRKVHVHTLLDEQVTVAGIRGLAKQLAGVRHSDTVVLFVAGHGTHTTDREADFLFVTHDFDPARERETGAPLALIEGLLSATPARRRLLLIDACESGERDGEEVAPPTAANLRARTSRALKRVSTGGTRRVPRPYVLDRDRLILDDLGTTSGTIVLGASRWNESSFESPAWNNGAFTSVLKVALTTKLADADKDGTVSFPELAKYVASEVTARTGGFQHPFVSRDNPQAKIHFEIVP